MPLAQKPVASPFNSHSLASEVIKGVDLKGKTAIVTGGSAGLGVETARALLTAGASVILPTRSRAKAEKVAAELRAATGNAAIEVADMDLMSFASVRKFAADFLKSNRPLHLLINNAGIMATPDRRMEGNIESQFGSNHLSHMLLTCLLTPALKRGAPSRLVQLSSLGHRGSPIVFDDPLYERRPYNKFMAYAQSKTANALFAVEFNHRHEAERITAFAAHPGMIMTELARDLSKEELDGIRANAPKGPGVHYKTPDGGASTAVWCATSPLLTSGGVYCEDCNVAEAIADDDLTRPNGVHSWAIDPKAAQQLWTLSEKLLGEHFA